MSKTKGGWYRIPHPKPAVPKCDICNRKAYWVHPLGGLRCSSCPKPAAVSK